MAKQESENPKVHKKIIKTQKSHKKVGFSIIKTSPNSPIQELMCREEHTKLFEDLCKKKQ